MDAGCREENGLSFSFAVFLPGRDPQATAVETVDIFLCHHGAPLQWQGATERGSQLKIIEVGCG